jgi:hypothetical protein
MAPPPVTLLARTTVVRPTRVSEEANSTLGAIALTASRSSQHSSPSGRPSGVCHRSVQCLVFINRRARGSSDKSERTRR